MPISRTKECESLHPTHPKPETELLKSNDIVARRKGLPVRDSHGKSVECSNGYCTGYCTVLEDFVANPIYLSWLEVELMLVMLLPEESLETSGMM